MNQTEYFTEKMNTLPEDLQEAIRASDYEKTLADIQREYKLHIDQGQVLETLGTQLMFGDIDAAGFVNGMFNEAHVSSSVAGDILLKIDMLILKKIRLYIEEVEEREKKDEELRKLLMDEEEEYEDDISSAYADYYAERAKALQEAEEELISEGISPDGENITDELFARELGISVDELKKKGGQGALQDARDYQLSESFTTPSIISEKEEMMRELESPEKSFSSPLFIKRETPITQPDHQLQNTHIEIPYIEEIVPEVKEIVEKPAPVETPKPIEPKVTTMKTPTKIKLSMDPYKEPIE